MGRHRVCSSSGLSRTATRPATAPRRSLSGPDGWIRRSKRSPLAACSGLRTYLGTALGRGTSLGTARGRGTSRQRTAESRPYRGAHCPDHCALSRYRRYRAYRYIRPVAGSVGARAGLEGVQEGDSSHGHCPRGPSPSRPARPKPRSRTPHRRSLTGRPIPAIHSTPPRRSEGWWTARRQASTPGNSFLSVMPVPRLFAMPVIRPNVWI